MIRPQRPNVFQRLARSWDTIHPYNAGQACRVSSTFEQQALDDAWNETLEAFSFQVNAPSPVRLVNDRLSIHFTAELNRRFEKPPFHAFANNADGSTWLGLVYQHWVADSFSVRLMLRDWLSRLLGLPTIRTSRERAAFPIDVSVLPLLRRYADYRRTRKVQTMGPLDYPARVRLIEPTAEIVPGLLAYARRHRVTVNDVFVAALAQVCDRLVPTESRSGRQNLAISSVVDLRRLSRTGFGCLLGFNSVVCRPRELADWGRLVRGVSRRRESRDAAGVLWMLAADAASRFVPRDRVYDFYRKEAPFAGGISNVNLTGTWFGRQHPQLVLDYIRVSPTGPMVPLVMNVTTLGDALRVSMTYRANLLNEWTARELGEVFLDRVMRISCGNV